METKTFTLFYDVMRHEKASNHSHVIISSYFLLCELGWTHFPSAWHPPVIILRSPTLSLSLSLSLSCTWQCLCLCVFVFRGGKYGRNHNWWRDRTREMGWAYSSRPSLPRQNKPGEWKSSYQGDSRQIKGDCQEIIALVFKPWLAVSCHNKTGGGGGARGSSESVRQKERERERKRELLICLACLLHATAVHLLWNGCIWKSAFIE